MILIEAFRKGTVKSVLGNDYLARKRDVSDQETLIMYGFYRSKCEQAKMDRNYKFLNICFLTKGVFLTSSWTVENM